MDRRLRPRAARHTTPPRSPTSNGSSANACATSVWSGTFTVFGRETRGADGRGGPRADRYDISSVEKVGENLWRFNAGMECCGVKGYIPIVIPMRFVGDTPMIMMTDTEIPGVGTFTVRLFFYGDTYSGTWQHGKVGGQMSGRSREEGFVVGLLELSPCHPCFVPRNPC
jgi:hypothetical protein